MSAAKKLYLIIFITSLTFFSLIKIHMGDNIIFMLGLYMLSIEIIKRLVIKTVDEEFLANFINTSICISAILAGVLITLSVKDLTPLAQAVFTISLCLLNGKTVKGDGHAQ